MKLKLVAVQPETADITSFIFEPDRPIKWKAGQYVRYVLPHPDADDRGIERWFTIAMPPYKKRLQITTRFSPKSSSFKRALEALPIGAAIQADEPEGKFVIDDPNRNYIFLASGIGITPFRAILAEADHAVQRLNVQLLYESRDAEIIFKAELDDFAQRNPNVTITYLTGSAHIDEAHVSNAIASTDNPYLYISGPEPMVEAYAVMVKKLGLKLGHIQTDFFPGYETN